MKDFLNRYMATNRNLQKQPEEKLREIFNWTAQIIWKNIGSKAFRPKRAVNAAVIDSLMTGVAKRLIDGGDIKDKDQFNHAFDGLMKNKKYLAAVETGTSDESSVKERLSQAEKAFSQIP